MKYNITRFINIFWLIPFTWSSIFCWASAHLIALLLARDRRDELPPNLWKALLDRESSRLLLNALFLSNGTPSSSRLLLSGSLRTKGPGFWKMKVAQQWVVTRKFQKTTTIHGIQPKNKWDPFEIIQQNDLLTLTPPCHSKSNLRRC